MGLMFILGFIATLIFFKEIWELVTDIFDFFKINI